MRAHRSVHVVFTCLAAFCLLAAVASADWFPGDNHKMHFPQLPDAQGWDVSFDGTIEPVPLRARH
jgi:hypothetical protein